MKYKSNVNQVISHLLGQLTQRDADALCREITLALYASQINRIHKDGLNVALAPIGQYSTKPAYYNVDIYRAKAVNMGKAATGRKRGSSKFASGDSHKRRYFTDGYEGFKAYLHYPRHVNLMLTKKLKEDTIWEKKAPGDYVIGFQSKYGSQLHDKLTAHFGGKPIWGITRKDRAEYARITSEFVKKIQSHA